MSHGLVPLKARDTTMEFALRTTGNLETLLASAQREVWRIEPAAIIDGVQTMSQRIDDTLLPRPLDLILFGYSRRLPWCWRQSDSTAWLPTR
jgi:hypothetical protein